MVKIVIALYFLIFALLIMRRPGYSLPGLVICSLGLEQWAAARDAYFGSNPILLNYASALLVVLAFVVAVIRGDRPLGTRPPWVLYAFYGLLAMSYFWAISRPHVGIVATHGAPYALLYLGLLPLTINSTDDLKHAMMGLLFSGVIVAVLLLFGGTSLMGGRSIELAEGAVNRYGEVEERGSPLAVGTLGGFIVIAAMSIRFARFSLVWNVVLRWSLVALGMATVFFSGSRGQLLALIPVVPLVAVAASPRLRIKHLAFAVIGTGIVVLIGWFATSFIQEGSAGRGAADRSVEDVSGRFYMCGRVLEEWSAHSPMHWLFGLGLGASWSILGIYPHVLFIQILIEAGIVGAFLWALFHISAGVNWIRAFRATGSDVQVRAFISTLGGLFLYEMILTFKQGGISGAHAPFLWPLLVARVAHLVTKKNNKLKRKRVAYGQALLIPSHSS